MFDCYYLVFLYSSSHSKLLAFLLNSYNFILIGPNTARMLAVKFQFQSDVNRYEHCLIYE